MDKFPLDLLGDFVAVQYDEEMVSDICLPDWQRSLIGTIVAMGPGDTLMDGALIPMEAKLGDRVSFGATVGVEAIMPGFDNVRILRERELDFIIPTLAGNRAHSPAS